MDVIRYMTDHIAEIQPDAANLAYRPHAPLPGSETLEQKLARAFKLVSSWGLRRSERTGASIPAMGVLHPSASPANALGPRRQWLGDLGTLANIIERQARSGAWVGKFPQAGMSTEEIGEKPIPALSALSHDIRFAFNKDIDNGITALSVRASVWQISEILCLPHIRAHFDRTLDILQRSERRHQDIFHACMAMKIVFRGDLATLRAIEQFFPENLRSTSGPGFKGPYV